MVVQSGMAVSTEVLKWYMSFEHLILVAGQQPLVHSVLLRSIRGCHKGSTPRIMAALAAY